MKSVSFEYSRPADIDEACALLAADDGARVIAGGQTLVPMMAMRLSRPARLIDVSRVPALAFIHDEGKTVIVGSTTRQCMAERSSLVRDKIPLLAKAMPWVGHAATRVRGTIGGSIANADPAAEIALVVVTLDATLVYRQGGKDAGIAASEFFLGPMITALPAGSCLSAVSFPIWPEQRVGTGFHEINARRSDFAFVSAAAQVAVDEDGICRRLALGIGAATDVPMRLSAVETAFTGRRIEETPLRDAVNQILAGVECLSDLHASADYRRRVAATLAVRAVMDAVESAQARGSHAH